MRTLRAGRKNRVRFGGEPRVGAGASKEIDDLAIDRVIVEGLATTVAKKNSDRYAPHALPRDAPVGARGNHVREPLFTPRRVPLHMFDFFERAAAQRVIF